MGSANPLVPHGHEMDLATKPGTLGGPNVDPDLKFELAYKH